MELTPFSLEDAAEVCEDFEDLIDTEFKVGSSPVLFIDNVCIAPFAEADKNSFVESYYQTKNTEYARSLYTGNDYDVILITCEAEDETNYSYIDIRKFADLREIKYSFPV